MLLDEAHRAGAGFLGCDPDEVVFGQNATSLLLHLSRSFGRTLEPGDDVVVTRLDHDANVRPWLLAARDAGANVRWVDVREDDVTIDIGSFEAQLSDRVKNYASTLAQWNRHYQNIQKSLTDITEASQALVPQSHAIVTMAQRRAAAAAATLSTSGRSASTSCFARRISSSARISGSCGAAGRCSSRGRRTRSGRNTTGRRIGGRPAPRATRRSPGRSPRSGTSRRRAGSVRSSRTSGRSRRGSWRASRGSRASV